MLDSTRLSRFMNIQDEAAAGRQVGAITPHSQLARLQLDVLNAISAAIRERTSLVRVAISVEYQAYR